MICHSGRSKRERGLVKASVSNPRCGTPGSTPVATMSATGLAHETRALKSA